MTETPSLELLGQRLQQELAQRSAAVIGAGNFVLELGDVQGSLLPHRRRRGGICRLREAYDAHRERDEDEGRQEAGTGGRSTGRGGGAHAGIIGRSSDRLERGS